MIPYLILLAQTAPPANQTPPPVSNSPTLKVNGGQFVVAFSGRESRVPISAGTPGQTSTQSPVYKKDGATFQWDANGLRIEKGSYKLVTRLPDIALTPKLFPRAEIISNRDKIEKGERAKGATRMAGSQRIGNYVYFLPRWEDKSGQAWLEALVAVNFADERPKPRLLGRFEGLTFQGTENGLFVRGTQLSALVQNRNGWGFGLFDPANGKFAFQGMGQSASNIYRAGNDLLYSAEALTDGRTLVSSTDLASGEKVDVLEARGAVKFSVVERPYLAEFASNLGPVLRNLETGVQMVLPAKAQYRKTQFGIVVWPEGEPAKAILYSNERYLRLATVTP